LGENIPSEKHLKTRSYAHGRFGSFTEMASAIRSKGLKNNRGNIVKLKSDNAKKQILGNAAYYAGFIEVKVWDYKGIAGKHQPLISLETYELIKARLEGRKLPKYNTDHLKHFPLRGHILCVGCNQPMTASFSSGKHQKYGYYTCKRRCEFKDLNIPFLEVHEQFVDILNTVTPAPELINFSNTLLKEVWEEEKGERLKLQGEWSRSLVEIEGKVKKYAQEMVLASDSIIKSVFEEQLGELMKEKSMLEAKIKAPFPNLESFEIVQKTLHELLAAPSKLWIEGDLARKQLVQRLVFPECLVYDQNARNFPNPSKALVYCFMDDLMNKSPLVVRPKGFEPLTF
tara:strand:- start:462 stop:1487 length:1026 start_codon:yes stop_codon:yes gene_type:complete